jgi:hypothetical protein
MGKRKPDAGRPRSAMGGAKPKMITFWSRVASTRRRFSACRGNRSEKVIEKGGLGGGRLST